MPDPSARELENDLSIRLSIPVSARSGDYFALIEAFPKPPETAGVVVGVAAATKLSFTVRASNPIIGSALWAFNRVNDASPFSYIVLGIVVLVPLVYWIRRRLNINISFERRS